jgi:hypothetical protein
MTTRYGTSHFVDRDAANRYYATMGFTPADVGAKLEAGEIHIGPPKADPGSRVMVNSEGRYEIQDWGERVKGDDA